MPTEVRKECFVERSLNSLRFPVAWQPVNTKIIPLKTNNLPFVKVSLQMYLTCKYQALPQGMICSDVLPMIFQVVSPTTSSFIVLPLKLQIPEEFDHIFKLLSRHTQCACNYDTMLLHSTLTFEPLSHMLNILTISSFEMQQNLICHVHMDPLAL